MLELSPTSSKQSRDDRKLAFACQSLGSAAGPPIAVGCGAAPPAQSLLVRPLLALARALARALPPGSLALVCDHTEARRGRRPQRPVMPAIHSAPGTSRRQRRADAWAAMASAERAWAQAGTAPATRLACRLLLCFVELGPLRGPEDAAGALQGGAAGGGRVKSLHAPSRLAGAAAIPATSAATS